MTRPAHPHRRESDPSAVFAFALLAALVVIAVSMTVLASVVR